MNQLDSIYLDLKNLSNNTPLRNANHKYEKYRTDDLTSMFEGNTNLSNTDFNSKSNDDDNLNNEDSKKKDCDNDKDRKINSKSPKLKIKKLDNLRNNKNINLHSHNKGYDD